MDDLSPEDRSALSKMSEDQKAIFVSIFNNDVALGIVNQIESGMGLTGNGSKLNGKELKLTSEERHENEINDCIRGIFAVAVVITSRAPDSV